MQSNLYMESKSCDLWKYVQQRDLKLSVIVFFDFSFWKLCVSLSFHKSTRTAKSMSYRSSLYTNNNHTHPTERCLATEKIA